jgi:hypothetical protein
VGDEATAKALHGLVLKPATLVSAASLPGGVVVKLPPFELWRFVCSLAQLGSSSVVGGLL